MKRSILLIVLALVGLVALFGVAVADAYAGAGDLDVVAGAGDLDIVA